MNEGSTAVGQQLGSGALQQGGQLRRAAEGLRALFVAFLDEGDELGIISREQARAGGDKLERKMFLSIFSMTKEIHIYIYDNNTNTVIVIVGTDSKKGGKVSET